MALTLKDRVLETCSAPGTGAVTLLGAVTGYQTFSAAIGNGNTCYYAIADQNGSNWEVGIGTYATSGNTLTRTTILSSSNAGSTVNFTSGVQNVFVTYPSERSVNLSSSALTSGRVTYATTDGLLTDSANLTFDGSTLTTLNSAYTGTLTGGTGIVNLGSGQFYKDASGNVGIGTSSPTTYDGKVVVVKTSAGTETAAMSLVNSDNSANTAVSLGFSPNANIDLARITAIRTTSGGLTDLAFKTYGGSPNQLREQMRITSAGAVLVNTTSTTGSTRMVVADATGNGQIRAIHSTGLGLNINQASASGAAFIQQQDNADLGFSTNNTERMRIDSSGNVGIATTSPSTYRDSQGVVLVVGGSPNYATIQARGDGPSGYGNGVSYGGSYSTNPINGARMWIGATGGSGQRGGIIFYTKDLDDNTTQPLERVRIDSSGNFLLGTTSAVGKYNVVYSGTYGQYIQGPSGASTLEIFFSGATNVGSISTTGTVTAFNVSSDRRLKENIVPLTSGLTSILAIKPSEYNYKSDPSTKMQGFIADELQQIIPHAVTGETNAIDDKGNPIYQGVDASFLVPHLVSAIQEQQALIESLTTRLTALENK